MTDVLSNWKTGGQAINLTNCDREPIHLIGGIQLHGCLLVLQLPNWTVIQASQNVENYLDVPATDLLGNSIQPWLTQRDKDRLEAQLQESIQSGQAKPLMLVLSLTQGPKNFTALVHPLAASGGVILELEPALDEAPLLSFVDFYDKFTSSIFEIQGATSLQAVCDASVKEVRAITGFDRVWLHRVVEDGHLKVIAEEKNPEQSPFLGLHFPATDIPKQARRLYTLNRLRLILDVNAKPSPLVPEINPLTSEPIDLSQSFLRAVSPIHLEYLKNTSVRASMSISLVKDGVLWGLISCHHSLPRSLDYEKRAACEFIGRVVSLQIPVLEARERDEAELKLRKHLMEIIKLMNAPDVPTLLATIQLKKEDFLALANADGAAICVEGEMPMIIGQVPSTDAVDTICQFVMNQDRHTIYSTDELSKAGFPIQAWASQASGLLATSLSQSEKFVVMWFRSEKIQTIPWGVRKAVERSADGERLMPRKSFEQWNEVVRGKSLPWLSSERQMAAEFRNAFVTLMIQRAKDLAEVTQELDSFSYVASHDLKEPLRGINTYATFLIEDYGDKLDENGKKKLHLLMTMTDRMNALIESLLHYSRIGRGELEFQKIDLNDVLEETLDTLRPKLQSVKVEVIVKLPSVLCDRIRVAEIFHHLLTNAIKFNESKEKHIQIGFTHKEGSPIENENTFFVRDNGIGIDAKHRELIFQIFKRLHSQNKFEGGAGAGLTIVKKIIERHEGKIWFESTPGQGTTFYFTLGSERNSR